ncbi:hypothetical protein Tco_1289512 [Tanacetum coccineum]
MNVSHPSVHPVEAPPSLADEGRVIRVRMKVIQGMPGTIGGLILRFCQFAYAIVSLVVMATTNDFPSVTAFWRIERISKRLKKSRHIVVVEFE